MAEGLRELRSQFIGVVGNAGFGQKYHAAECGQQCEDATQRREASRQSCPVECLAQRHQECDEEQRDGTEDDYDRQSVDQPEQQPTSKAEYRQRNDPGDTDQEPTRKQAEDAGRTRIGCSRMLAQHYRPLAN